jgi:hypothetical protein
MWVFGAGDLSSLPACCTPGAGADFAIDFAIAFATAFGSADVASCGLSCGTEAVRTGVARFGFAAISVLLPRKATVWLSVGLACAGEPPKRLPSRPAIDFGCAGGASPSFACGADCGIGTLAITKGWLVGNGNGAQAERNPKDPATWGKVGRNESCPCGSGKKFKHCHGKYA